MTYDAQLIRHLEPDAGPDHDDGAPCACEECMAIIRDEDAERRADMWRDERA